ncbi:hypothetical protein M9458_038901, partial [Cirrhinus mrigala]
HDAVGPVAFALHPHVPAAAEPGSHAPVPRVAPASAPKALRTASTRSRLTCPRTPSCYSWTETTYPWLNLSHNAVETLGEGAFVGLEGSLEVLDLSHNRITSVHKDAFARLKARVMVDNNPWHCDCALQQALGGMAHNHEAATRVLDQEGQPFLAVDADLCNLAKRTTDYAMLVTMFGWFAMVISYVVYYVRQNQEDARRHLEYLKSLPSKPKKPDEPEDISTVV